MAKKVRFPLEMRDGVMVRTLHELTEHFDLEKALEYVENGKLETWLRDRRCADMADGVQKLDISDAKAGQKLCEIIFSVGAVAFEQDDLYDILDEGKDKIYLLGKEFEIPLEDENVTYIGLNNPVILVNSKEVVDWEEKGIQIKNCVFDEAYQTLLEEKEMANESGAKRFYREMKQQNPEEVSHSYEELEKIAEERLEKNINKNNENAQSVKRSREICPYNQSELFSPIINDNDITGIKEIYEKIQDALLDAKSPVEDVNDDDECKRILSNILRWYEGVPNLSHASENPIEIIFPREYKNNFADWLIWRAFARDYRYANALDPVFDGYGAHNAYTLVTCTSLDLDGAKEFIDGCKKHRAKWESINPKYHFLYYTLLILAVDDDAYSNELNSISEFIYFLNISVNIIEDFLWVVFEILSDKETNTSHNFSTVEARDFFERS